MESIAARVKSRRSQPSAPAAASEAQRKAERIRECLRKRNEKFAADPSLEVAFLKSVSQGQASIIRRERARAEAAEKEVAALKKQVQRAGVIWEISPLREFNEVRFTDGMKRFVNPRGDCVDLYCNYIGHFYWHTRRLCSAFTAPADWAQITAGIVLHYAK
jgi:hypothetical protein